ncbi:MAG: formyl transferase [Pseudomonadota bacterium]
MANRPPARAPVLLIADTPMAAIVANRFRARFPAAAVIVEPPEPKRDVLARRRKLLGARAAASQALAGLIVRAGKRRSAARADEICRIHGFDRTRLEPDARHDVASVNSPDAIALLQRYAPPVVVVYGTRLLRPDTLSSVPAPFVNYHAGLTPQYRGQHPGYWALAAGEPEAAGVTVHLVDRGVDTGAVIAQSRVPLARRRDGLATFQLVQMAHGLPLLLDAAEAALKGELVAARAPAGAASHNHFPPTLGQYLANGLSAGVW